MQVLLDEMLDSACGHRHAYGPRTGLEFEKQRRVARPGATCVRRSSDHQGIPLNRISRASTWPS